MRIQKNFKNSLKEAQSKLSTSRNIGRKRVVDARGRCKRSSRFSKQEVSDKLEALKSLIPPNHNQVQNGSDEKVKAEELFQETADYIINLKTQVLVLQKLIEFYGDIVDGSTNLKQNNVLEHQS